MGRRETSSSRQYYLIWGFFFIIQVTDYVVACVRNPDSGGSLWNDEEKWSGD